MTREELIRQADRFPVLGITRLDEQVLKHWQAMPFQDRRRKPDLLWRQCIDRALRNHGRAAA